MIFVHRPCWCTLLLKPFDWINKNCAIALFNYNFTVTYMSMRGAVRNLQSIPSTCLCGASFLVVCNVYILCNLPCTMRGIVRHGVATLVTISQRTHLGKYLTMTYCKNATKQLASMNQHGITLILYYCPLLWKCKVVFSMFYSPVF